MKDLKAKTVKNRVRLLRALPYKGSMVYIRMIGTDLFMYDLIFKNEIYSSNMIFTPRKGETKLSNVEIERAASLLWAGAVATINSLMGIKLDNLENVERFIKATEVN